MRFWAFLENSTIYHFFRVSTDTARQSCIFQVYSFFQQQWALLKLKMRMFFQYSFIEKLTRFEKNQPSQIMESGVTPNLIKGVLKKVSLFSHQSRIIHFFLPKHMSGVQFLLHIIFNGMTVWVLLTIFFRKGSFSLFSLLVFLCWIFVGLNIGLKMNVSKWVENSYLYRKFFSKDF